MNIAPLASDSSSIKKSPSAGETSFPTPKQTLDADDFMKILMTQLTAQDPMNPMKDTEFIAQMANFSSLEQMRTLSQSFTSYSNDQKMAAAPSYLGCEVTVKDAAEGDITGVVEAITLKEGAPALVINGKTYETNLITDIRRPLPILPATPVDPTLLVANSPTAETSEVQP
jgi:flagellar basal-body rod modification protein FlgD